MSARPLSPLRWFALALAWVVASAGAQAAARQPDLPAAVDRVIDRSNAFRTSHGLGALRPEASLSAAAQRFAAFLARSAEFSHVADGHQPAQRAAAAGYDACLVAENIAYEGSSAGFSTDDLAEGFVQGWIESPGHRRNLLEADATQTGVAIARAPGGDRWYAVQMFGRPASMRLTFQVDNRSRATWRYRMGDQSWALPPGVRQTHEVCGARTLEIDLPGSSGPVRLQPVDGGHYRIEDGPHGARLATR